jgi:predicted phosphodiesterase
MVCSACGSQNVVKRGFSAKDEQRHRCSDCGKWFTATQQADNSEGLATKSGVFKEINLNVTGNILAFGCVHLPFEHPKYLEFLKRIQDHYSIETVICLGDIVDGHSISMHDRSPDGFGASHEIEKVKEKIAEWAKVFPDMYLTYGNHDKLPFRQAHTNGLPKSMIKDLNTIYGMPKGWQWADRVIANDVVYMHGTGRAGQNAAKQWMEANRKSTVIAHVHSAMGVAYSASPYDRYFAMSVGCGIDVKQYAFEYNKDFSVRPMLGCAVILDEGNQPISVPMYLGDKW